MVITGKALVTCTAQKSVPCGCACDPKIKSIVSNLSFHIFPCAAVRRRQHLRGGAGRGGSRGGSRGDFGDRGGYQTDDRVPERGGSYTHDRVQSEHHFEMAGNSTRLEDVLRRIDGKGYKAYNDILGGWLFDGFTLIVDHIQGDPFALPSRVRYFDHNSPCTLHLTDLS